jgi:hypothetical protein
MFTGGEKSINITNWSVEKVNITNIFYDYQIEVDYHHKRAFKDTLYGNERKSVFYDYGFVSKTTNNEKVVSHIYLEN